MLGLLMVDETVALMAVLSVAMMVLTTVGMLVENLVVKSVVLKVES